MTGLCQCWFWWCSFLCQPGAIFETFQNIRHAEKLDAVRRRVGQRLEQAGRDQRRNIVRLAV
jgi:hypothetical protein